MEELQNIFQRTIDGIKKLVDTNRIELRVGNWLAICHDTWNTITMDGALGSSIKLTTKKMETYTIAAILEKNNESHTAADVGEMMRRRYEERFGIIDCVVDGGDITSDTCKAVSNVADVLEGEKMIVKCTSSICPWDMVSGSRKTKKQSRLLTSRAM